MDLEMITLSEISQRKVNIIWYCLYVESKKKETNEFIYKIEMHSHIENKHMATKGDSDREGEGRGEINLELGLTDTHHYI